MRTIFKALNAVQSELAQLGIGKNQRNDFDKYQYRGIDDVLNALAPILARNGVLIVPSVVEKELRQVTTQKGGVMNFATLRVDYTMYDSEGDSITHTAYGEAMDRGDKSINKAMTAAYKYFVFQAFCVPLVGHDADSESHQITEKTLDDWIKELQPSITAIQEGIANGELGIAAEAWAELSDEQKHAIWVAPSKGGPFTTQEREIMKSTEFKQAHYGEAAA